MPVVSDNSGNAVSQIVDAHLMQARLRGERVGPSADRAPHDVNGRATPKSDNVCRNQNTGRSAAPQPCTVPARGLGAA